MSLTKVFSSSGVIPGPQRNFRAAPIGSSDVVSPLTIPQAANGVTGGMADVDRVAEARFSGRAGAGLAVDEALPCAESAEWASIS
jgi:hypothetical protein